MWIETGFKFLLLGCFGLLVSGCSSLNGKIELRSGEDRCLKLSQTSQSVYLVNTSSSNIYTFTVKTTRNYGMGAGTSMFKLYPGEEKYIGCTVEIIDKHPVVSDFEITGEVQER